MLQAAQVSAPRPPAPSPPAPSAAAHRWCTLPLPACAGLPAAAAAPLRPWLQPPPLAPATSAAPLLRLQKPRCSAFTGSEDLVTHVCPKPRAQGTRRAKLPGQGPWLGSDERCRLLSVRGDAVFLTLSSPNSGFWGSGCVPPHSPGGSGALLLGSSVPKRPQEHGEDLQPGPRCDGGQGGCIVVRIPHSHQAPRSRPQRRPLPLPGATQACCRPPAARLHALEQPKRAAPGQEHRLPAAKWQGPEPGARMGAA